MVGDFGDLVGAWASESDAVVAAVFRLDVCDNLVTVKVLYPGGSDC